MKKMQMMALTLSLFSLNLVVISLPARGERRKNCGRYPVVYAVDNRKNEFKLCLFSTEYNKHGTIYRVGFPSSSADTIYKGKDGDAILQDWQGCARGPCPPPPREYGTWKKTNQYYLFTFLEANCIFQYLEF